jgi:hypothetical protein
MTSEDGSTYEGFMIGLGLFLTTAKAADHPNAHSVTIDGKFGASTPFGPIRSYEFSLP